MFNLLASLLGETTEAFETRIDGIVAGWEPDTTMPPHPTTEALAQLGIDPDWYAAQFDSNPWVGADGRLID